jgi:protein TonB
MNNMRMMISFGFFLASTNIALCQTIEKGYTKFTKGGLEYQTNGTDTICVPDRFPEFPGGKSKLDDYLVNNLKFHKKNRKDTLGGKVIISFVVDKSGDIRDVTIVNGLREDVDNEVVRVVKMMPRWKPGGQKEKLISFKLKLPINIKL